MPLDSTLGALEVGVMMAVFLFGVMTVQTHAYFRNYPGDSWKLKSFVGTIWILELGHAISGAHALYFYTIQHYGQPDTIQVYPITMSVIAVVLAGLIGPSIQAFFANRIRLLSSSWLIPCICWFLCFLRALSLFAAAAASYSSKTVADFTEHWWWLLTCALSISATADVLIAASLCYYLWDKRKQGRRSTQRIVDHLILWTIQTGLLTSIATVLMLVFFLTLENYAWLALLFIISRLFSNSLVVSLNSREYLRTMDNKSSRPGTWNAQPRRSLSDTGHAIEMTRTTEVTVDDMGSGASAQDGRDFKATDLIPP